MVNFWFILADVSKNIGKETEQTEISNWFAGLLILFSCAFPLTVAFLAPLLKASPFLSLRMSHPRCHWKWCHYYSMHSAPRTHFSSSLFPSETKISFGLSSSLVLFGFLPPSLSLPSHDASLPSKLISAKLPFQPRPLRHFCSHV